VVLQIGLSVQHINMSLSIFQVVADPAGEPQINARRRG